MTLNNKHKFNILELLIYSVIFLVILLALQYNEEPLRPHSDSLRYIHYSVNLNKTGYFGLPGEGQSPGNQNMPLYPYFVSTLMDLSSIIKEDVLCLSNTKTYVSCSLEGVKIIFLIQATLMLIPLISVWLISRILFTSKFTAWLAGFFCLASGRLINFSSLILTEALLIPLFSFFLVAFLLSIKTQRYLWYLTSSFILGVITLTRPEYIYLFYFFTFINLFYCYMQKQQHLFKILIILFIGFFSVVGPWMVRNAYHFDSPNLTSSYASVTLVQRVAYNRMSWKEWGTAFVYWFPDMGDSIAKKLFKESNYNKLTYNPGSYYLDSEKIVSKNKQLNNDLSVRNLLKHEVLNNIFKHSMVSIPLFWKGTFVGKYWGVLGLICFILFTLKSYRERLGKDLLFLGLPLWFMVALHAFVSINVARYNIFLIPYFSLYIAIIFTGLFEKPISVFRKLT